MDQYAEAPQMLAADHDILAEPVHEKLKHIPGSLELWLKRTYPIVNKLNRQDASTAIQQTQTHYHLLRLAAANTLNATQTRLRGTAT